MSALVEGLLRPEFILVAMVAIGIIIVVFFVFVINKIASIDNKVSMQTEDVDKLVERSMRTLGESLHDELGSQSASVVSSLSQMGDSWRDTLNKTVADMRSELGQFKNEFDERTNKLDATLKDSMAEQVADVATQIAEVRDGNSQMIKEYHENLATQVSEHAKGEQETLVASLNAISKSVQSNLEGLVTSQTGSLEKVSGVVAESYSALSDKVDTQVSGIASRVDEQVTGLEGKLDRELTTIRDNVDDKLGKVTGEVTKDLGSLVGNVDRDVTTLTKRINDKVTKTAQLFDEELGKVTHKVDSELSNVTKKVDAELGDLTGRMDTEITQVRGSVEKSMGEISGKLDSGIGTLNQGVADNFSSISGVIDERIKSEMSGIRSVFQKFASKVDAIEATRTRIADLAENVSVLSSVLDDRRSRGTFGKVVIDSIVKDALSPSDYELNAKLSTGTSVDCLLKLPQPSGNVAISTKIDLNDLEVIYSPVSEDDTVLRAREEFGRKLADAIQETASSCIIAGETADGAVLLLTSEAAFSEAHTHHRKCIDDAYQSKVWLASPSTLIAMVTVARTVIKDADARKDILVLRDEIAGIEEVFKGLEKDVVATHTGVEDLIGNLAKSRKTALQLNNRFLELNAKFSASFKAAEANKPGITSQ